MADLPPSVTVSPGVSVNLVQYLRPGVSLPSARLLVLLHHGIGEHAGRYEDFASALLAAAPSLDGVLSYNCRGHGTSAPRRRDVCAVAGVAQLVDDFSAVLTHWAALAPDARFVLAGHSLGGLVIAGVAAAEDCPANGAERARIGGVVLSAPALKVHVVGLVNKVIAPVAGLVASIPGARCITKKNGIPVAALTSDVSEQQKYVNDPLNHDLVSVGLGADFLRFGSKIIETVRADAKGAGGLVLTSAPLLIVYGEADPIVDFEGGEMLLKARPESYSGKLVRIPTAKHEPFNDAMRPQFFSVVANFLTEDCCTTQAESAGPH